VPPLTFPNGATRHVSLGPDATCYKGSLSLQGAKSTLRYLNAVSASFPANGTAGQTFIMNLEQATKELTWATVVTLLGLPAEPRWGNVVLGEMRKDNLIGRLDGIGCDPECHRNAGRPHDQDGTSSRSRFAALSGEERSSLAAVHLEENTKSAARQ
jgi:hypothetical protein